MSKYKLITPLGKVNELSEFPNAKAAWNKLRLILPGRFATLYREVEVEISRNNPEKFVEQHNLISSEKISGETQKEVIWIPVMSGLTDDEFNLDQHALNESDLLDPSRKRSLKSSIKATINKDGKYKASKVVEIIKSEAQMLDGHEYLTIEVEFQRDKSKY